VRGRCGCNAMACVKHYAANSTENSRFFVNVKVDDRTLREVYLPHFKKAVGAGAACVMGAYGRVNGDHCCESKTLLNDILREEWGFEGFTMSDFLGGVRSTEKAIQAGMDIEMPVPAYYGRSLLRAVQEGKVPEETVNTSVLRILRTLLVFENCPDKMDYGNELVACMEHTELARQVAEKSMVLIKNANGVLPFDKGVRRILVVGALAAKPVTGDEGSSRVDAPYVVTLLEGLRGYFGPSVQVVHLREEELDRAASEAGRAGCVIIAVGNDARDEGEFLLPQDDELSYADVLSKGYRNMGKPIKSIVIKPLMKSVARPFLSRTSKLGGDRQSLSLKPVQVELIGRIGGINPNTVVTLTCGGMVMTREWEDCVPAILYSWYSGMEGGNALVRVLFGGVNPSGKLPFTIPCDDSHLPYFSSTDREITYDLYHGYTLLDRDGHEAAYSFGFGLSYTSWQYSEPELRRTDRQVVVSVELKNTGPVAGAEVVQVYVGMKRSAVDRPKKLLKGFEKVYLEPGQSKVISIPVEIDELRYFCTKRRAWILEPGTYLFYVGSSSDDSSLKVLALGVDGL
jgi:beta-glucosidase